VQSRPDGRSHPDPDGGSNRSSHSPIQATLCVTNQCAHGIPDGTPDSSQPQTQCHTDPGAYCSPHDAAYPTFQTTHGESYSSDRYAASDVYPSVSIPDCATDSPKTNSKTHYSADQKNSQTDCQSFGDTDPASHETTQGQSHGSSDETKQAADGVPNSCESYEIAHDGALALPPSLPVLPLASSQLLSQQRRCYL
jgi:hypothetical protein